MERMGKSLLLNGAPSPNPTPFVTPTPTGLHDRLSTHLLFSFPYRLLRRYL